MADVRLKTLFALALCVAACKKARVKECEDLVATAEKIQKCGTLPQSSRDSIERAVTGIKDALKGIDDAKQSQLDAMAKVCQAQVDKIRSLYEKSAPECLE